MAIFIAVRVRMPSWMVSRELFGIACRKRLVVILDGTDVGLSVTRRLKHALDDDTLMAVIKHTEHHRDVGIACYGEESRVPSVSAAARPFGGYGKHEPLRLAEASGQHFDERNRLVFALHRHSANGLEDVAQRKEKP